ncbi:hypothetical protein KKB18_13475 [bacterium]|nr:hypothetical protein [bacterium]
MLSQKKPLNRCSIYFFFTILISIIFLYNPVVSFADTTYLYNQIIDDDIADVWPKTDNGQIIWIRANKYLMLYDKGEITTLNPAGDNLSPDTNYICDGYVVWSTYSTDTYLYSAFIYNIATKEKKTLTKDVTLTGFEPSYYVQTENGKVVWNQIDVDPGLYFYDGNQTKKLGSNSGEFVLKDGLVVWIEYGNNRSEIFLYDGNEIKNISNTLDFDQWDYYTAKGPGATTNFIDKGQVVWTTKINGSDNEIMFYDGFKTIQLTDNEENDISPEISDGQIAWFQQPSTLMIFDGVKTIKVADNMNEYGGSSLFFRLQNGNIMWENTDNALMFYDGVKGKSIQLESNIDQLGYFQFQWDLSKGKLVWFFRNEEGTLSQLKLYDGTSAEPVIIRELSSTHYTYVPQIESFMFDEEYIVWIETQKNTIEFLEFDGEKWVKNTADIDDYDIFFCDIKEKIAHQLTRNDEYNFSRWFGDLNDGVVTWHGTRFPPPLPKSWWSDTNLPEGESLDIFSYTLGREPPVEDDPIPDIKANGADGSVDINSNDSLSVTIVLDPKSHSGKNADWWIGLQLYSGGDILGTVYCLNILTGSWTPGLSCTYQGPLFNLTQTEFLNVTGIPSGKYTFFFAVDLDMNGIIDAHELFIDMVVVNVN